MDAVMELFDYEDSLCSCGRPLSETSGKANTFRWVVDTRICHACKAVEMAEKQLGKTASPGTKVFARQARGWVPSSPAPDTLH